MADSHNNRKLTFGAVALALVGAYVLGANRHDVQRWLENIELRLGLIKDHQQFFQEVAEQALSRAGSIDFSGNQQAFQDALERDVYPALVQLQDCEDSAAYERLSDSVEARADRLNAAGNIDAVKRQAKLFVGVNMHLAGLEIYYDDSAPHQFLFSYFRSMLTISRAPELGEALDLLSDRAFDASVQTWLFVRANSALAPLDADEEAKALFDTLAGSAGDGLIDSARVRDLAWLHAGNHHFRVPLGVVSELADGATIFDNGGLTPRGEKLANFLAVFHSREVSEWLAHKTQHDERYQPLLQTYLTLTLVQGLRPECDSLSAILRDCLRPLLYHDNSTVRAAAADCAGTIGLKLLLSGYLPAAELLQEVSRYQQWEKQNAIEKAQESKKAAQQVSDLHGKRPFWKQRDQKEGRGLASSTTAHPSYSGFDYRLAHRLRG